MRDVMLLIARYLGGVAVLLFVMANAQARDQIHIAGSSTVFPFTTVVAERFARQGKFKAPVVESTGTGGGFKVFCEGVGPETTDINDASRPITDSERKNCAAHGVRQIDEFTIGYDGIILAAALRQAQPMFHLTREQLWQAVAKVVPVNGRFVPNPFRNWSEIDPALPKRLIHVYGPAPNHGTRDALVELVLQPMCEKTSASANLDKDERATACSQVREDGGWTDVSEDYSLILEKLRADQDAAGVFTFSYLDQNRDKIEAAKIDGVAASLDTIASGQYPISRPLFIYVKQAHVGVIPGMRRFVREFLSVRAAGPDGYLADKGLIPLPPAELARQNDKARKL